MIPVIFSIGPLHLYSFGLMVALGVLAAMVLAERRARADGFPSVQDVFDLIFVTLGAGFIGARLAYVIQEFESYAQQPLKFFAVWEGGLIFYGGSIAAFAGLILFMRFRRIPVLKGLDFLIPYGVLTHAFGRIGCFLNGCCYGKPCDLPWAVKFPDHAEAVHPTQLYEAVFNLILFFILVRRYSKKHYSGEILCLYFMIYSVGRFMLELLRADNPGWLCFSWNQWLSLALFSGFGFLSVILKRKADPHVSD